MKNLFFVAAAAMTVSASPVTKVVELIKELQAKTIADGENEQKVYDKFACWCEKTTDRKAKAIEQAKKDIARLGNEVLTLKGKVATLAAEIAKLQKQIKENEEDQAKSTSIRQKENTDFQQEKAEMEQTLNALERAIKVLSGAGTGKAFVQFNSKDKSTIDAALALADVPRNHVALIKQFMKSGYAPQSASIQGILKDMYTTFATNLEEDTQVEFEKQTAFEKKIALLQEELAAMQEQVAKKSAQKADTEVTLADTTQTLEDTTNQMNDDAEFFDLTKKNCKTKADEWSERTRLRTEELDGIAKALEVLTSDEARALFDKAIKPGMETGARFIQVSQESKNVNSAIHAIQKAAASTRSLKLAALAVEMRKAGHFDKVIKAIDDMIQTLREEETDDKEKRDECKEKTHRKSEEKYTIQHKIERNVIKIDKLNAKKAALEEELAATAEAIAQTQQDIETMTADREAEHAAFLQAKEDDENAVALLTTAIGHLSSYLDANKVDMGKLQNFMQQEPEFEVSEDQAPDASFKGKDSNKQESKGIVSILTMLKTDLEDEITNGVKADEAAEKMFQENLAAAKKLKSQLEDKKVNLEGEIADTEAKTVEEEDKKKANEGDLKAKQEELDTLKPGCDWINENFSKRREFRAAESEGLAQAKAILSGMKTSSLISEKSTVHKASFDDSMLSGAVSRMSFLQRK